MNINDKVVIVTGASSGIGEATARLLTKLGAKVALAARSKDKLLKLSTELPGSLAIQTDTTVEKDIKDMVAEVLKHYGRIDILINNAGRGYGSPLEFIEIDKYLELFKLDVVGPLIGMQAVIPIMRAQGGGMIINISSGTTLSNLPGVSAYASLKHAINGLSLIGREELKKDKIIVSVVYPYITATNFYKDTMKSSHGGHFDPGSVRNPNIPPPDAPEHVAEKIAELIKSEVAEEFAQDWMRRKGD